MENIKVAIWGFGAMGSGVAKVLLRKKGVDITGVCDIHPARVGKSIFEVLGVERGERADVLVSPDIEAVGSKENHCNGFLYRKGVPEDQARCGKGSERHHLRGGNELPEGSTA